MHLIQSLVPRKVCFVNMCVIEPHSKPCADRNCAECVCAVNAHLFKALYTRNGVCDVYMCGESTFPKPYADRNCAVCVHVC